MERPIHPRLLDWWQDNPSDPDRPSLNNPDVQRLISEIGSVSHASDIGGVMSLNVRLEPLDLLLRVHQPFVSRQRILAIQQVRCRLAQLGLAVPIPVDLHNSTVFQCGKRWAELEKYLSHTRLKPILDSYQWLFAALGTLHHTLARLDMTVPRPLIATYSPPRTLSRWLKVTEMSVQDDTEASALSRLLHDLINRLRIQWLPATRLPQQLVHGDVRLSNICQMPEGKALYLDFGFLAHRPRIHDIAYSLAFILLTLNMHQTPERFSWQSFRNLIATYEETAHSRLTSIERKALTPYTAAIPLYSAALSGFSDNPVKHLRDTLPFLHVSEWLLNLNTNPF